MEYRKEVRNKPGRQLGTSSPRDVRRRQQEKGSDAALIVELQRQISDLRDQFKVGTGGITPEDVDAEIRKSVKAAVAETKAYYEPLLAESKRREEALREKLKNLKDQAGSSLSEERESHRQEVEKRTRDLQERYNSKVSSLEDRLRIAEDKLEDKQRQLDDVKAEKDETIKKLLEEHTKKLEALTERVSMEKLGVDDPDRPSMEDVFVDPLEDGAGSDLEAHIKYEEEVDLEDASTKKKKNMSSKVNRLRDLMGSFADKED